MYHRPEADTEQTANDSSQSPDNHVQLRKKGAFRKSSSAEPVMSEGGKNQRKKSFTTFWSNLFGNKIIPENRNSGISTQSSSFESVNTILSTNSFSFVSPKKYKGKQRGKRIPVPVEEPAKPRRKISTLTRLGMRIGLKSKYNLQSCESLHNLSYLESSANSDAGTLGSTFRRKRRAPLPPNGTLPRNNSRPPRNASPLQRNCSPLPRNTSPLQKFNTNSSKSKKENNNSPLNKTPSSSKTNSALIKAEPPAQPSSSRQPLTVSNSPSCSKSNIQQEAVETPAQEEPKPGPSTVIITPTVTTDTFKITARHKRSSSEGTSRNAPNNKSKLDSNTLSNTYKTKSHVRGKRKAPVPPNPFLDPDAPDEEVEAELARNPTAVVAVPIVVAANASESALAVTIPNSDNGAQNISSQVNAEVAATSQASSQTVAVTSLTSPTQEQDEEIAQNILNDKQEQRSAQQLQHTEQDLDAAQKDLQVLIAVSSQQNRAVFDETAKVQLAQLKREADKSPLMLLRPKSYLTSSSSSGGSKSPSGSSKTHFNFNLESEHERNPYTPPASPVFHQDEPQSPSATSSSSPFLSPTTISQQDHTPGSPSKIIPRPWYKRNITSGSQGNKKSKQLIKPVSSMTKFSDIDREASRIVEENRRRSAEQSYNETARELITMFNAFNKSQIAAPTESDGEVNAPPDNAYETDDLAVNSTDTAGSSAQVSSHMQNATDNNGDSRDSRHNLNSGTRRVITGDIKSNTTDNTTINADRHTKSNVTSVTGKNLSKSSTTFGCASNASSTSAENDSRPGPSKSSARVVSLPSASTSTSSPITMPNGTTEEPKKLAIVQPQSSSRVSTVKSTCGNKSSEPTAATKVSAEISPSAFLNTKREKWTCPRCTLQNSHWQSTCDACYFKAESTVQKLSSVFENASGACGNDASRNDKRSGIKSTTVSDGNEDGHTNTSASGANPHAVVKDVVDLPLCENFLSQFPAKETLAREGKLVGMKLHKDTGEDFDILKLRQARLAFFEKNVATIDGESLSFACVSTSCQQDEGATDVTVVSNNLAVESNDINGNSGRKEIMEKKELNVFSDDEDDSIDALLQIPRFRSHETPIKDKELHNMPTFSGPNKSWNPLHLHRFRPMLESILESSNDVYLRLNPIYENWDLSQNQSANSINCNVAPDSPTGRTWTNTFMLMHDQLSHNSPTDNNNGYYANSNSDSSSCSEYESQALGIEIGMDGKNRAPSRRHSSHHHYMNANQEPGASWMDGRKLTLDDYRKLGAIPKNFEGYYNYIASPPSGLATSHSERSNGSAADPRRHSSYNGHNELRSSEGDSSFGNEYANSTVAVNKLLRKLEIAISKGDHRLAATLAHDLALLKVNCVVAKGEIKSPPITIRVYVEDRFMQQGPFQVQVTLAMSVKDLKNKIQTDWNIPSAFQKWILGRKIAEEENQALAEFDVEHDTMAFLYLVTPEIEKNESLATEKVSQSTDTKETARRPIPATPIMPELLLASNTNTVSSSSDPSILKPVGKKETQKLLAQQKVTKPTLAKSNDITATEYKTNIIGEKVVTPSSASVNVEVNKVLKPIYEVLPVMKAPSNIEALAKQPDKQFDLIVSPETKPALTKKDANKSAPITSEHAAKPSKIIKSVVAEPIHTKYIPSKAPQPSFKTQAVVMPELPVISQSSQKSMPKREINIQKYEPKTIPLIDSPTKAESPTNPVPKSQVMAVLTTAKSPVPVIRPKKEEQNAPLTSKKEATSSSAILKQISNPKSDKIKSTKPVRIPVPVSAKTDLANRNSDIPNWNPEPIPMRRTKNLKKNVEVNAPIPESTAAETQSKNITPVAIVEQPVINLQPPKPPKSTNSQIQTEHVYSNGTSTPLDKSPTPTSSSPLPSAITQTQDIPPPLPEKKPMSKETKVINTDVAPSTDAPQAVAIGPVSPETKSPGQENNHNIIDTAPAIVNDIENVAKEPENVSENLNGQVAAVIVSDEVTARQNEDNRESYLRMLHLMEQSDLISNAEEVECPICFLSIKVNEGVVLKDCLHCFCRECLIGSVKYADEPEVKCPFRDDKYSCNSVMQEREIKALVPPEIFERYLASSVKAAECKIVNTFHCKTADCTGWCVFEDDVNIFNCPVCKKRNCLTCQAIHEGVDCQQYQRQLAIDSETDENAKSSRLMLEKMIQRGEALECPACHVVLLKKWGCDWVRCSYCKTEICWITKGFRWGPNGKGDTSGGCQCGVNGVRCHPKCTYCH